MISCNTDTKIQTMSKLYHWKEPRRLSLSQCQMMKILQRIRINLKRFLPNNQNIIPVFQNVKIVTRQQAIFKICPPAHFCKLIHMKKCKRQSLTSFTSLSILHVKGLIWTDFIWSTHFYTSFFYFTYQQSLYLWCQWHVIHSGLHTL